MGILETHDKESFNKFGWVVKPSFVDGEDLTLLAGWIDELESLPEVPGKQMVYYEDDLLRPQHRIIQRIEKFGELKTELHEFMHFGDIKNACDFLFTEPGILFKEKVNLKHPGGSGFKKHQDQQAGWSMYAPYFISVLVAIDRADVTNGCLYVRDGDRLNTLIGPEWSPLDDDESNMNGMIPVEMDPGDVLFFDSYVVHGSLPNRSSAPRRNLYLTYNKLIDGDWRSRYFADKRSAFPPDIERDPSQTYAFRV